MIWEPKCRECGNRHRVNQRMVDAASMEISAVIAHDGVTVTEAIAEVFAVCASCICADLPETE